MKKVALILFFTNIVLYAQSYPPAAGQPGSTAIPANSQLLVSWATGIELARGFVDISNPSTEHNGSNYASFGEPEDALGPAANSAVSLGDAGEAVLTFGVPITDGPGFDFAVFENSFSDTFLELAFVEVSSDGINYFRFPSHSETQTNTQVEGFGNLEPTFLNNFAGKYRALFGTPFDLSELQENPLLDKNSITHIKIIDVVGSINPQFSSYDSLGNAVNDPFNTPFFTGGFDLAAVGVLNEQLLGIVEEQVLALKIYPNPVSTQLFINAPYLIKIRIYDMQGREVFSGTKKGNDGLDVSKFENGMYILRANHNGVIIQHRFIKSS
ncbi:T9SS type A sorting domain-containing protein [Patiriisocius sp. Uisw_017]|jgi:hypothetical protein|uniref:T9SS type A sorting domain-containing protein n=1 Tax=Patiriisocius sp. Uisw_017 TaxID=3230968 RepID=UPI0039ECA386